MSKKLRINISGRNSIGQLHGYQEWYNGDGYLWVRDNWYNGKPIGYQEYFSKSYPIMLTFYIL